MIVRVIVALLAFALLAVLLHLQQPAGGAREGTAPGGVPPAMPGFVALGAELIETGDDGQPLYRLDAARIAQPQPQGLIFLSDPTLQYQPTGGNPWVVTARRGELPQSARTAELTGSVHAEGKPNGSSELLRIDTNRLHVDMSQQLATTTDMVHIGWADRLLRGRGMRADLLNGHVALFGDVSGVLVH
jgi:LPS export ABC transporter protein LptC